MVDPTTLQQLESELRRRLDAIDVPALSRDVATSLGLDVVDAEARLRAYLSESTVALRLVGPHLLDGARILEVGSGVGFFCSFLREHGFDVVDLEPTGVGFEFIGAARSVLAADGAASTPDLDIGVDELSRDAHGSFDLVYSLNVLEHVPDWRHALDRMHDVLEPGGRILQSCPNYTFPYEPHFGIPLVPFAPGATAKILPERITETGLWRSLNWITARQVRTWASTRGVDVEFRRGQLADALQRLTVDPEFAERHTAIRSAMSVLTRLPVIPVARRLPADLTSPMQFTVTRNP